MPRQDFYETVLADTAVAQTIGATGGVGDFISHVLVVPATTSPGEVALIDGATEIVIFAGGTVPDVKPFTIPLLMYSKNGPWKITTGSNVAAHAVGNFGM